MRIVKAPALLLGISLIAGCSRYAVIAAPWTCAPSDPEFGARPCVQIGDRSRITTRDQRVLEGPIVALDSLAVTVLVDSRTGNSQAIPAADVVRFEKFVASSWRPLKNVLMVGAGAMAGWWFVDGLTQRTVFSPDPTKHE